MAEAAIPYIAMAAAGAIAGSMQKPPKMPDIPAPAAPPQGAKSPDIASIAAGLNGAGQAGGQKGPGQTFLTGPSGVDPNSLKLGKATLLGQ